MKVFNFILIFITTVILNLNAKENESIIIAHMFSKDSLPDLGAKYFAKTLNEIEFKTQIVGEAKLGDERENLRQLQRGEIDIAIVGDLVLDYLIPKYRLISLPFLHNSIKEAMDVYNSSIGEDIQKELSKMGIIVLSWHTIGERVLTANKPIKSKKDLESLKLRLPPAPVWMAMWEKLGANTKAIPFPMLYDALKRGEIEAQENPPNFIRLNKFYEVQPYLILTNHLVQRQFILASKSFFEKLSKKRQEKVITLAKNISNYITKEAIKNQEKDIEWLRKEAKMKVIELDLFKEATKILIDVARELDGEDGVELLKKIIKIENNLK